MQPPRRLSLRVTTLLVGVLVAGVAQSQRDGSLAGDFEKMSAKERARVAKEEQDGAAKDVEYQSVMAEAEKLFQQQNYEASMVKFKAARTMRPYNVYPKVKIQDLEALMAKLDGEKASSPSPPEEPIATSIITAEPIPPPVPSIATEAEAPPLAPSNAAPPVVVAVGANERVQVARASIPVATVAPEVQRPTPRVERRVVVQDPLPVFDEGEHIYKEGRSVVVERRVAIEGRIVVFRRVNHPWGEVHHFREGIAITGREFEEATGR